MVIPLMVPTFTFNGNNAIVFTILRRVFESVSVRRDLSRLKTDAVFVSIQSNLTF